MTSLVPRPKYLEEALLFRDTDLVKVITGVRRCGKSSLLRLVQSKFEEEHIDNRDFITLNLEMRGLRIVTDEDLYAYITSRIDPKRHTYIFIDEIQRVPRWHDVINSLRVEYDCDIYVTGSNAFLLSSELATYLSGRYVEVNMLPLAFEEYCRFCRFEIQKGSSIVADPEGNMYTFDDVFQRYLRNGGMPALASMEIDQIRHSHYIDGLYSTVVVRDVMARERNKEQRRITDVDLLNRISEYLADAVGRETSVKKIADTLTSSGRKTTPATVEGYLSALEDAYIVYSCKRYDIHGKALLKTLPKYYLVDTGIRQFLDGYRNSDRGYVFENAVYLQLLYEGWNVHVGKLYKGEIDFVAVRDGEMKFIQVADELSSEKTRMRELDPLRSLKNGYEKIVVIRKGEEEVIEGIKVLTPRTFFLGDKR